MQMFLVKLFICIKNIKLHDRLFSAPVSTISHKALRHIARELGGVLTDDDSPLNKYLCTYEEYL